MRTILVVEDDHDSRVSLRECLEDQGFSVYSATNGRDGLETLGKMPRPCLILLDYCMPFMNGEVFVREKNLNPDWSSIPVVMISAHRLQVDLSGVKAFFQKPIDIPTLNRTLALYCSQPRSA